MLIEWLYSLKENIDRHGIRWGVIITVFVLYRKELRNKRLDLRDEALFHNQRIIMDQLGIGDQWRGQPNVSCEDLVNRKQLRLLFWEAISRVGNLLRRVQAMQINKAWLSGVVAYILGQLALKYGFTWNDAWSDTVTDIIITFAIPLIVAFMNRTKEAKADESTIQPGSNK